MNISMIKKLNEDIPYWMKRPFAKFIRNRLIKNSVFLTTFNSLVECDKLSEKERLEYQKRKLIHELKHAYNHSKYYHYLFDKYKITPQEIKGIEDLQKLPILTKETLKLNLEDIVADDVEDSYVVTTGGTTGEPIKVMMARDAIYKEWAFIYHYWSKFGYDYTNSKLATFRGIEMGNKISMINPLYAEIRLNLFSLSFNNIEQYISEIKKFKADFIYGYPSAIYNFCRIAKKKNISLIGFFKGALFISENLYEFQEKLIKEVLQCPMIIFYGQSERAVFAERYEKGYVFNPYYGIVEISDKGEPIVTGFINSKTPLIRYLVDDYVQLAETENYYTIEGHRSSEILIGNNGEQVSAAAINFHDDTFSGISAYQFIQDEIGKCVIKIAPDEGCDQCRIDLIETKVANKLGPGFKCVIEVVNAIHLTSRGKYRLLVQNIKKY